VKQHFDYESYLFDLYDNEEEISQITKVELDLQKVVESPLERNEFLELLKLPPKHLLLSKRLIKPTTYQLLDICFCYLYELVCMSG